MKIKELFIKKSTWTQHAPARKKNGNVVNSTSSEAIGWCLFGAINKCYDDKPDMYTEVREKLEQSIKNIVRWNDAPDRTFAEVKALVRKLDI